MHLVLLFLGKTKERCLTESIETFRKRLSRYCPVEIVHIKQGKFREKQGQAAIAAESDLLEQRIGPGDYRVALDRSGAQMSSEELASFLTGLELRSVKRVCFIIGGPLGLAPQQLERADTILSLSKMTFTHDMSRLLLVEQLYRAYSIKAGSAYHK